MANLSAGAALWCPSLWHWDVSVIAEIPLSGRSWSCDRSRLCSLLARSYWRRWMTLGSWRLCSSSFPRGSLLSHICQCPAIAARGTQLFPLMIPSKSRQHGNPYWPRYWPLQVNLFLVALSVLPVRTFHYWKADLWQTRRFFLKTSRYISFL